MGEKEKYPKTPILFVDDEEQFLLSIELIMALGRIDNYLTVSDSRKVRDIIDNKDISLVVLDLNMPHIDGKNLLKYISETHPEIPVIILTAINEVSDAVECMKMGAIDYLVKPVDDTRLLTTIKKGIERRMMLTENENLKESLLNDSLKKPEIFNFIVTQNKKMNSIFKYIEAVAATPLPILINGETGVGKELIAKAIHDSSQREGELVTVNVAGIDDTMFSDTLFGHEKGAFTGAENYRKGLIERAEDGTLFLDEIGDLSIESQVKLLRLLQDGSYYQLGSDKMKFTNARIIVATNRDLNKMQEKDEFRRDLYYRLKAHQIIIPALRERKDDIPLLLQYFLEKAAIELNKIVPTAPKELITLLKNYSFPGNVRELEGLVFDAVSQHEAGILSMKTFKEKIDLNDLNEPEDSKGSNYELSTAKMIFGVSFPTLKDMERIMIEEALERADNNQRIAAELLGISRRALNNRLNRSKENN